MLKKSGIQYTITSKKTSGTLKNTTTPEADVVVIDAEAPSEVVRSAPARTTSFSELNQQVQAQTTNATATAIQGNGALFSDVSELLQH